MAERPDLDRLLREGRIVVRAAQALLDGGYAFDSGWRSLPEHFIVLLLAGDAQLSADRGRHALSPGDAAWIPPGVSHRFMLARGRHRLLRLRLAVDGLPDGWPGGGARVVRGAWRLRAILQAAHEVLVGGTPAEPALRALLALAIAACIDAPPRTEAGSGLGPAHLARLEAFVARGDGLRATPADCARHLGMTPDWFARRFRQAYGLAPRAWLAERRLQRAADLLAGGGDAGEVARRLGYAAYGRFAARFRARFGASPGAWRRAAGTGR